MADPKDSPAKVQSDTQKAADKQEADSKAPTKDAPATKRSAADIDSDRSTGVSTGGTTTAQQAEFKKLGVNPALDNRTGDQRPVLSPRLKPQQVPGPEVGHFAEHHEEYGDLAAEARGTVEGEVMGMKATGPLGRNEETNPGDVSSE